MLLSPFSHDWRLSRTVRKSGIWGEYVEEEDRDEVEVHKKISYLISCAGAFERLRDVAGGAGGLW